MGIRVYNSKTGVSTTCDAKYWAECSDHGTKAGYILWSPDMTSNYSAADFTEELDSEKTIVTIEDYNSSDADYYEENDFGTCSECGEEDVEIYDTDNYTCLDCYSNHYDNETDGDWMDADALDSVGWGNDESYY